MIEPHNPYAAPKPVTSQMPIMGQFVLDKGGMTIDYEIGLDDYATYSLYHHAHSPSTRATLRRTWTLLAFVYLAATLILWLEVGQMPGMWPLAVAGSIAILLVCLIVPSRYRKRLRQQVLRLYQEGRADRIIGARRVTISTEHFFYATPYSQTLTKWAGVERVVPADSALYIYLSAVSAVIIPRRAFASNEQFHQWTQLATSHHAKAAI